MFDPKKMLEDYSDVSIKTLLQYSAKNVQQSLWWVKSLWCQH